MQRADFDTPAGFAQALQGLVQAAAERRLRRLVLVDPSYEDWPLESSVLLDSLTAFVRLPGRQVLLLGRGFEALRRSSPRLVAWRRTWAHAVQAARPFDDEQPLPCAALADRTLGLWVRSRGDWAGVLRADEPQVARWALEIDALAQRSRPDFPAYVLGL